MYTEFENDDTFVIFQAYKVLHNTFLDVGGVKSPRWIKNNLARGCLPGDVL